MVGELYFGYPRLEPDIILFRRDHAIWDMMGIAAALAGTTREFLALEWLKIPHTWNFSWVRGFDVDKAKVRHTREWDRGRTVLNVWWANPMTWFLVPQRCITSFQQNLGAVMCSFSKHAAYERGVPEPGTPVGIHIAGILAVLTWDNGDSYSHNACTREAKSVVIWRNNWDEARNRCLLPYL